MAPDAEPPRRIFFEFEKPRPIWRWLVPAGVAAALIIAVLIAVPMQIQWHDSQLTITMGTGNAAVKPAVPNPIPTGIVPTPQPVDYERVAKQVEDSQRTWLADELKKHDAEQLRQIRSLQGEWDYLEAQQKNISRENVNLAAIIQQMAQRPGEQ